MTTSSTPVTIDDPINVQLLAISEDRIEGFQRDPIGEIAQRAELTPDIVLERLRALLAAGTIRRIRQTMVSTNLARGALVAWQVPEDRLQAAFDHMFQNDPFSGHVVIRTSDATTAGARYRLWTTLKVPEGFSLDKHCRHLADQIGATHFRIMPAKRLFRLGVGHTRRRDLEPGARTDDPAAVLTTNIVKLDELEWRVLTAIKREFTVDELQRDLWTPRAAEAGVPLDDFFRIAEGFQQQQIIGRFSTFLEHVKPVAGNQRVTRYNALFHWAVAPGRELDAGREVGRHHVMTHAYWREGGPEFHNVNIMGVAHGMEKERLLAHKAAIDAHLADAGIPVGYTTVFWGGRSEIKPSEVSPVAYRDWCRRAGLDHEAMRQDPDEDIPEDLGEDTGEDASTT